MRESHHHILGSASPALERAFTAYLALNYYVDPPAYQQQVWNELTQQVRKIYQPMLIPFVASKMKGNNRVFVDDIIQSVIISFYEHLVKYAENPAMAVSHSLRGLLKTFATREVANFYRTHLTLHVDQQEGGMEASTTSSHEPAIMNQQEFRAYKLKIYREIVSILKLIDLHQRVLHYLLIEEETYTYISTQLDIEIDYAQKIMKRISERLIRAGYRRTLLLDS